MYFIHIYILTHIQEGWWTMRRKGGREKTTLSNLSWWFISTEQSTGGLPIYVFFTFIAYIFWFSVITMDLSTKKGGGGESLGLKLGNFLFQGHKTTQIWTLSYLVWSLSHHTFCHVIYSHTLRTRLGTLCWWPTPRTFSGSQPDHDATPCLVLAHVMPTSLRTAAQMDSPGDFCPRSLQGGHCSNPPSPKMTGVRAQIPLHKSSPLHVGPFLPDLPESCCL